MAVGNSDLQGVDLGLVTSAGRQRQSNQDNATATTLPGAPIGACVLVVVADGMGGHQGGEMASGLCVGSVVDYVKSSADHLSSWPAVRQTLTAAIEAAHARIRDYAARENSDLGTTVTAAIYCNGEVEIAHVGDSRAYIVSNGIRQITDDDSWVAEQVRRGMLSEQDAATSANRNQLTQALTATGYADIHTYHERLPDKTCLMLCTDGLHGVVKPELMKTVVWRADTCNEAAQRLVEAANAAGGPDNITAACLWRGGGPPPRRSTIPVQVISLLARQKRRRLALVGVFCVAAGLFAALVAYPLMPREQAGLSAASPDWKVTIDSKQIWVWTQREVPCSVYFGKRPLKQDHREGMARRFTPARNQKLPEKPLRMSGAFDANPGPNGHYQLGRNQHGDLRVFNIKQAPGVEVVIGTGRTPSQPASTSSVSKPSTERKPPAKVTEGRVAPASERAAAKRKPEPAPKPGPPAKQAKPGKKPEPTATSGPEAKPTEDEKKLAEGDKLTRSPEEGNEKPQESPKVAPSKPDKSAKGGDSGANAAGGEPKGAPKGAGGAERKENSVPNGVTAGKEAPEPPKEENPK